MSAVADLSHDYYPGMPHAGTIPAPSFRAVRTLAEHGLRCMELTMPTHLGTHLDAPAHFIDDGATVDELDPAALVGPARCVEVAVPADTAIEVDDLAGPCADAEPGEALLVRTGWDARYGGPDYGSHPYLSDRCAEWVVERGFRLLGVDTVTPELPVHLRPRDHPAPVHRTLLGSGVLIVENLDLRAVVDRRFSLVVAPLRIAGGDGSPARALALLD